MSGPGHETAGEAGEPLATGYAGRLFVSISVGWLAVQMGRQALPPLLPVIIDDLAVTPFRIGVALTVMWGLYAAAHFPSGRLSDRLSRKTVLVPSVAVLLVGFLALFRATSYPLFVAGAALVGIGAGFYFVTMRALSSELYVRRRGQAFGLQMAAGTGGSVLAAGLAVWVLGVATWRAAFLPTVAVLVLVALAVHGLSREPYVVARVEFDLRGTARRVFATGRIRWLAVAYSLFALTWQGVVSFLPTVLQAAKGFSPALASAAFAATFVVGVTVMPIAGNASDRFDRVPVAVSGLALAALGLASLSLAPSTPVALASVVAFAVGLMTYPPVMQAYLMDAFPDASAGGDFGAFKTIYTGVGSLGPTYVGYVAGRGGYDLAYLGLVACLLASALIVWRVAR